MGDGNWEEKKGRRGRQEGGWDNWIKDRTTG
jgi:hypothetical protein